MATAKALVRHVEGRTLIAKAESNHWIPLDSLSESTPNPAANSPVQLLLIACAGCVSIDIVSILAKSRQKFSRIEIEIEALRRDTPPKIIRRLNYIIRVDGPDLDTSTVQRAVEFSLTKYCSVSLSLDRSVRFFTQLVLNGVAAERKEILRNPALYDMADPD